MFIAALSGAFAGIAISSILGTEKAKQIVSTIDEGVRGFSQAVTRGMREPERKASRDKVGEPVHAE
jgi:hypothetical protein